MKALKLSPKTLTLKMASFIFAETLEANLQHSTLLLESVVTEGVISFRRKEAGRML
jgi:hypothetical protein